MSRGHVQGYDSNAAQFERMGNPWEGEPVCKRQARKARRKKGLRPCRAGLPRRAERDSRNDGDALLHYQCKQALAAKLGLSRRTITPDEKSPTLAKFEPIKAARDTELTHDQRIKSRWQRFEFRAKAAVAEAAYLASEKHRAEERRLIERRIEALQARLTTM